MLLRNVNRGATEAKLNAGMRLAGVLVLFGLFSLAVVFRLMQLQVFETAKYRALSGKNGWKSIPISASRAPILDRNGRPLATDVPSYRIVTINKDNTWDSKEIDYGTASRYAERGAGRNRFVSVFYKRYYPEKEATAHITGYVAEINEKELANSLYKGKKRGDIIGKSGLEKEYDDSLTGTEGSLVINARRQTGEIESANEIYPRTGDTLHTTIDVRLQREAYRALAEKKLPGAVIVMDSESGEILAMASYPSFDSNLSVGGFRAAAWERLSNNPGKPLINRTIGSALPPGSVFKLATAVAALEEGKADTEEVFHCSGRFKLGTRVFRCWDLDGHGQIRLIDGIAQSCDVVFYNLGLRTGVTSIKKYAKMLGLGRKTGIDLPGEMIGIVPTHQWKRTFLKAPWYNGDTVNTSIGQGFVNVTPIQALVMTNVFATRGMLVVPHLKKGLVPVTEKTTVSDGAIEIVRQGMRKAVTHGTAGVLRYAPYTSAGKTGTAEAPPRRPHAWFSGFAPYDQPQLTFAVVIENGGHGGSDALPVVKRVTDLAYKLGYLAGDNPSAAGQPQPLPVAGD